MPPVKKSDIDIELIVALTSLVLLRKKPKIKARKRWWVKPYLMDRKTKGRFAKDVSYLKTSDSLSHPLLSF
jgi:hypothetical protein